MLYIMAKTVTTRRVSVCIIAGGGNGNCRAGNVSRAFGGNGGRGIENGDSKDEVRSARRCLVTGKESKNRTVREPSHGTRQSVTSSTNSPSYGTPASARSTLHCTQYCHLSHFVPLVEEAGNVERVDQEEKRIHPPAQASVPPQDVSQTCMSSLWRATTGSSPIWRIGLWQRPFLGSALSLVHLLCSSGSGPLFLGGIWKA